MKTPTSRDRKAGAWTPPANPSSHDARRRLDPGAKAYERYEALKRDFRDAGLTHDEYERACRRAAKIVGL